MHRVHEYRAIVVLVLMLAVAGCGGAPRTAAHAPTGSPLVRLTPAAAATPSNRPSAEPSYAVAKPGPLRRPLLTADVLITGSTTLPAGLARRLATVRGVSAAMPLSVASAPIDERTVTVAAVDPGQFRRFTPVGSAQSDAVWDRVAGGEVALDPALGKRLEDPGGMLRLGNQSSAPSIHVGAYAPMVRRMQAVVNEPRGRQLGIPWHNAILVSTGELTPSALRTKFERIVGDRATITVLALEFDVDALQTAVLTGGSVASAVGSFTYVPHADGTVSPDAGWVAANIVTETVPILGAVRCHRVMLAQLRPALAEIVQRGLAATIHRGEYGGCYYPRYIAYDPGKGLSLHTWGIAIDLNVPGNQRGTVGQMDPAVVAIFKKWGFAWGGDWHYTDPMHFELSALVAAH